jgi:Spy/CpxP family protein refolding chaperone
MSRMWSLWCGGAASALLACGGEAIADTPRMVSSLPQWVTQAEERLALQPEQQRELRLLVDGNAERLDEMRERFAGDSPEARRAQRTAMAGLQLEFRQGLAAILTPRQLAEWDQLVEELLGQLHLRHGTHLATN